MALKSKARKKVRGRARSTKLKRETFPTMKQLEFIQSYAGKHGLLVGLLVNVLMLLAWLLYQCHSHKVGG